MPCFLGSTCHSCTLCLKRGGWLAFPEFKNTVSSRNSDLPDLRKTNKDKIVRQASKCRHAAIQVALCMPSSLGLFCFGECPSSLLKECPASFLEECWKRNCKAQKNASQRYAFPWTSSFSIFFWVMCFCEVFSSFRISHWNCAGFSSDRKKRLG